MKISWTVFLGKGKVGREGRTDPPIARCDDRGGKVLDAWIWYTIGRIRGWA